MHEMMALSYSQFCRGHEPAATAKGGDIAERSQRLLQHLGAEQPAPAGNSPDRGAPSHLTPATKELAEIDQHCAQGAI